MLKKPKRYESNLIQWEVPTTFKEATTGPEANDWTRAIEDELEALVKNNTWTLVPKSADQHLIDSKWVFKVLKKYGRHNKEIPERPDYVREVFNKNMVWTTLKRLLQLLEMTHCELYYL